MKKTLLSCMVLLITIPLFGQSVKEMLAEIDGKYELDNSGNVTFTRIIEVPNVSKNELYTRALSFFTYNYNSGSDVVQVKEKEQGLIVGKGIYPKVHIGTSLIVTAVDTYHILRVDIKEGRLRAMVTLTEYKNTMSGGQGAPTVSISSVSARYPIAQKDPQKTIMGKAFYKSYKAAMSTLDRLEKSIQDGNTGMEDNEW